MQAGTPHKREHVKYVEADQAATRERRIVRTVATLAAVKPKPKAKATKLTRPAARG